MRKVIDGRWRNVCNNCDNVLGSSVTKCPKCGEATLLGNVQALSALLVIAGAALCFLVIFFAAC